MYGVRVWFRYSKRAKRIFVIISRSLFISLSNAVAYLDIYPGTRRSWLFRGESCVGLLEVEFAMAVELFGRKGPKFRG